MEFQQRLRVITVCLLACLLVVFAVSPAKAASVQEITEKAKQGNAEAQYNLAVMYFKGESIPQNYVYSYAWFKLAESQGDEDARQNSDHIASLLSPEQLAKAQELISELQQKIDHQNDYAQNDADDQAPLEMADDSDYVRITPFQFSILNPVQLFPDTWNVYGLRASIIYGKNEDVYGVDLGFLANKANNVIGIQLGGFQNKIAESFRGIQVVGIGNNGFDAAITGVQVGFGNAAKDLTGIQIGACSEASDSSAGVQCGAIFTKTENLKGVQFGCINIIEHGSGVQFGIGNIATKMSGLQLGLVNIITDGFLPVFPIVNFSLSNSTQAPENNEDNAAPSPQE